MKTKLLKISEIVTTAGTQIRAKIDVDTVDQYAEAMQDATNKFPAVVVFHDGSQFILADGFHRVMAASRNGFLDIEADVRKGTRADALKYALGANATHGLKRTNADKHRSVELALNEWPRMSDSELSRICAVSIMMVGRVRKQLEDTLNIVKADTRLGADGKEYHLPTRRPTPAHEPIEEEATEPEHFTAPTEDDELPHVKPAVQCRTAEDVLKSGVLDDIDDLIARLKANRAKPETLEECANAFDRAAEWCRKQ